MTSKELIAQARTYLGVKWRHQGFSRDGCDCVGLLVAVANDFGIQITYPTNYSHRPSDRVFLEGVLQYCDPVPLAERRPGDFLFFRNTDGTWHLAIQTDYGMVHSTAMHRKVVEHRIDESWLGRLSRAYRFKGMTDGRIR